MVKSMFASIAGLKTHQSKLDVISNNIANVNTWGFKARSANFADSVYQNSIQGSGGNMRQSGYGGMNTSQIGFGVNMSSISTDFTTGNWNPTGNGLHCMINGPSFFLVGTYKAAGAGVTLNGSLNNAGLSLSRVGIFNIDDNGYLVDDQGNYIYGYRSLAPTAETQEFGDTATDVGGTLSLSLTTLRIPAASLTAEEAATYNGNGNGHIDDTPTTAADGSGARKEMTSYTIGQDGTIVGIDIDGIAWTLGRIAVASVQNVNGLEQDQGYLYQIGDNAGEVIAQTAGNELTGKILSGFLEMANVDLATEISEMIKAQRGYQANTKIVTVTDEMLETLINMKR